MNSLLRFYNDAARLKTLKRAGWGRCGVEECESVAEHSFGVALLALAMPKSDFNREHCVALALVHDLAESIVGDITPHDRVDPEEKRRREEAAIREFSRTLGNDELTRLWLEFEEGKTAEAKLVRELDVIEMAWQARAYQQAGKLSDSDAEQFIESARSRVQTEAGRELLRTIL